MQGFNPTLQGCVSHCTVKRGTEQNRIEHSLGRGTLPACLSMPPICSPPFPLSSPFLSSSPLPLSAMIYLLLFPPLPLSSFPFLSLSVTAQSASEGPRGPTHPIPQIRITVPQSQPTDRPPGTLTNSQEQTDREERKKRPERPEREEERKGLLHMGLKRKRERERDR